MSQTILLKRSAVQGKKPQVGDLQLGEIAVNTYDGKMYIKKDNGTASIEEIGKDQFPSQSGKIGMFLKTDGTQVYWSDTGGTASKVTQTAHGFAIGNVLRYDGSTSRYVRAQSNIEANAEVIGVVTKIVDANNFELTTSGVIDFGASYPNPFTPGTAYFLSASTAGGLTATEPTGIGNISKPLFIALTATSGLFYNWRGIEVTKEIEIDDMLPAQAGNSGNVLMSDGVSAGWVSIAAATSANVVTMANSFTVGQVVRATNNPASPFVLAQANNVTNANVYGIISFADPSSYTVTTFGRVVGLSGLTAGVLYYLSDTTAGALTSTEPTTVSSISKPVFIATSATEGMFYNQRGLFVGVAQATPSHLLPSQSGNAGKFLTTNGSSTSWQTIVYGVSAFNSRTGSITLTASDVTTALGATFVQNASNATNLTNGSISGCTGMNLVASGRISWPANQYGGVGDAALIDCYSANGGEAQRLRLYVDNDADDLIELNAAGGVTVPRGVIYGTATSARYADLAEKYTADANYDPGTVVSLGGEAEVTVSRVANDTAVAGIISTAPAHLMNADLQAVFVATVGLVGRVPCKVTGPIKKGDLLVSNGDGTARAETNPAPGSIVGKAMENFVGGTGMIEVLVGKH